MQSIWSMAYSIDDAMEVMQNIETRIKGVVPVVLLPAATPLQHIINPN